MTFGRHYSMAREVRSPESGLSLIELLVSMTLLIIVMGAILSLSQTATRNAPKDIERAQAVRSAQVGLSRMVRELRQSYEVLATTGNSVDFRARVAGQDLHLRYECNAPHPDDPANPYDQAYRRCLRYAVSPATAAITASTPSQVVVDRVLNGSVSGPVFEYSPDPVRPTYAKVQVELPARGERKQGYNYRIVLNDGVFMRNLRLDD